MRTVHPNTDPFMTLHVSLYQGLAFAWLAHVLQASLACLFASLTSPHWLTGRKGADHL
ncbi:uncharacterized protein K441DRAFT_662406 [Cenococcum geophilum 1.58]|uniref:uncharacterized protein n=1 Tax=Cenococcum geophilum 1.58 TaxID=794803 RepID=UPI00358F75FF|nr:hypothetical protein K441DRAFT_662406 [Cenococcum geophilum 1.58]